MSLNLKFCLCVNLGLVLLLQMDSSSPRNEVNKDDSEDDETQAKNRSF